MERRGAAAGSRVIRLLLHVCVLAGVLAMHALTMNHDVTMVRSPLHGEHGVGENGVGERGGGAHGVGEHSGEKRGGDAHGVGEHGVGEHGVGEHGGVHGGAEHRGGVSAVAVHGSPVRQAGPPAYLDTAPEPMGSMCVAFLGALTLIGLALYLIWQRSVRPVPSATLTRVVPSAVLGRSPPWLTPSLSKLCVLRT